MTNSIDDMGVATISYTTGDNSSLPYIEVTGSFTATNFVTTGIITNVRDIIGDVGVTYSRVNATTAKFYATRQIPSEKEIVFYWTSLSA